MYYFNTSFLHKNGENCRYQTFLQLKVNQKAFAARAGGTETPS